MVEFPYKNEWCITIVWDVLILLIFLERVLFSTDIIIFKAPNYSRIEIYRNELYWPKLEERIIVS